MWNRATRLLTIAVLISFAIGCGGGSGSGGGNGGGSNTPPALPQASSLSSQAGCSAATPGQSSSGTGCSIQVSGGKAPYSWNVTSNPGLASVGLSQSISADTTTLVINAVASTASARSASVAAPLRRATPMASSTNVNVQITATVSDANGKASSPLSFTIVVTIKALGISSTTLPNGTVGVVYSASVSGSGGAPPYSWTITGLPQGLSSTGALISGTPTQSGTFTITVRINDSEATPVQVQVTLSLTINPAGSNPLSISSTSSLTGANLNGSYSTMVSATGGTAPYSFSLASGSALPPGLNITSGTPSATIAGTPTETGTFQFTVDVQDSASTPATAHATFTITVTGSSTLNCPATVNLTLCGTYVLGATGAKGSQGFGAVFVVVVVNNSGNVISGEGESNDSISGDVKFTITGGSSVMDSSGDGRGVLTIIDSTAAVRTFRFGIQSAAQAASGDFVDGNIVEFDNTGNIAEGGIFGPELATAPTQSSPVPPIPANTILALALEGVNGAMQRVGLLASFQVGSGGCNGSAGSFNSLSGEPVVTNAAGTVDTNLSATGSCTAPDPMGVGTFTIALSGGTPFTNNTLHFSYINVAIGSAEGGVIILATDSIANNQPILVGFVQPNTAVGLITAQNFSGFCPCVVHGTGTTNGTIAAHTGIAQIVRIALTFGSGNSGTVSGLIDENAAGSITAQGTWAYTAYSIDSNGTGTFTASGHPTIHFIYAGDLYYLDESMQVRTGQITQQNSVTIESPGLRYIASNNAPRTLGSTIASGVVVASGSTAGTLSGTLDLNSETGQTAGFSATGTYGAPTYTSLSPTTGRGTGTADVTSSGSSGNVVVQAMRHRRFLILSMDPSTIDPWLLETQLQ